MPDTSTPTARDVPLDRPAVLRAISDLQEGRPARITDPDLAYELAHRVKPYIDELAGLREVHGPEGARAAAAASTDLAQEDTEEGRSGPATVQVGGPPDSPDLATLSASDQARWIFMDRFVSLDQHQQILRYELAAADRARHDAALAHLLEELLLMPEPATCAAEGIPALQRLFANQVLVLRNPFMGDAEGNPIPCTLATLREYYPPYFYRRSRTANWYENWSFYTEPMERPGWALLDTEYLNCTLRSPARRLEGCARRWQIPVELVQQKTVLEDVYDRVICGEATGQNLFEQNCSSCTCTHYGPGDGAPERWVHTVQRSGRIAVHGRPGLPHWRATRRLWPGVFPVIALP